jgi:hypothetical protein
MAAFWSDQLPGLLLLQDHPAEVAPRFHLLHLTNLCR